MAYDKKAVRAVLDQVKKDKRKALTAPEAKKVCDAYNIPLPKEGLATSADKAGAMAKKIGFPVVMKIVSPDILHKTEAGGVMVGVNSPKDAKAAYATIIKNAKKYNKKADITGVQIQKMLPSNAQEVIVGAVTDPSFGKLVAFGLGGILVEVLKDITFRLAPTSKDQARGMLESLKASDVLKGVRGQEG
ncbi:MAG: acetate--CoA ligase family protein, partial [Hyphomicrobiales bacterium]